MVGPKKQSFHIHKSLLIKKIPYFTVSLGPDWGNNKKSTVEVQDVGVVGFRIVMHWAYTGALPEHILCGEIIDLDTAIRAYEVADRLMVAEFQNLFCDKMIEQLRLRNSNLNWISARYVHEHGLTHTPIYQLVLKSAVPAFMEKETSAFRLGAPKDMQVSWVSGLDQLLKYPDALRDVLTSVHTYNNMPWEDVWDMDCKEFHIDEVDVASRRKTSSDS